MKETILCKRDIYLKESTCLTSMRYALGVATISRLLKCIGPFCKKSPIKETIFCKRDVFFQEPTYVTPMRYAYKVATIRSSLKLLVSFAKEPYKRDHILQKRHIFEGAYMSHLYEVCL